MIYKEKFAKILELYRVLHKEMHAEDYIQSWGSPVYGVKIYKSSDSEDDSYVAVDHDTAGVSVNINGTVKVQQTLKEGERTLQFSPEAYLDDVIRLLETKGTEPINKHLWLLGEGQEIVRVEEKTVEAAAPAPEIKEVPPDDYGVCKGKAEVLDRLLSKKTLQIIE